MKVLAIAGSVRAGSASGALVRAVAALAPPGVTVEVWDGLGTVPIFSPDLDGDGAPPAVAALRARLAAADAALVCTPEYAFGMPGALKNALDWLVSSGELNRKPVAALSASPSAEGGVRALGWLRQTLTAIDAVVPEAASFAVPFVRRELDGDRIVDAALAGRLRGALDALGRAAAGDDAIRPFGPADHDAVVALWTEVFAGDPPRNAPAGMIARKATVQPELFLVAIRGGAVVGTVLAGFDGVRGWVHHLAVHPSARRTGIATRLMARAEEGLAALGCPKVNLQVRATNDRIVSFYARLGYRVEERISMGKELAGGRHG